MHNRCVERVVMDNILGCPSFGPHKRRLSSQQFKKLCACVSCLSSNCSFRVLAVRFDLIASLRRVSHWSAQDPFDFFRWFLFFKCLGRRFCQQSPRPCRNVRFPRFARGGAAVIADLVPKATRLSQDPHAKMAVEAVAAVHACSLRRMMVSIRDLSCRKAALARCCHVRQPVRFALTDSEHLVAASLQGKEDSGFQIEG